MAPSSGRRVRPVLPLALDGVAIALLLIDLVGAYRRDIGVVLLVSAVTIPVAIAGAVTSGVHLVRRARRIPRWAAVLAVVVVGVAAVPLGAAALAVAASATPNPAADAAATVGRTIEAAGGRRVCGAGDPGLGPDNTQPYFFAAYEIPADLDVQPQVEEQARRLGWTVSSDADDDLQRTTPRLELDEGGSVLDGACGQYGRVERASSGTRLVQLEVVLPYRR